MLKHLQLTRYKGNYFFLIKLGFARSIQWDTVGGTFSPVGGGGGGWGGFFAAGGGGGGVRKGDREI